MICFFLHCHDKLALEASKAEVKQWKEREDKAAERLSIGISYVEPILAAAKEAIEEALELADANELPESVKGKLLLASQHLTDLLDGFLYMSSGCQLQFCLQTSVRAVYPFKSNSDSYGGWKIVPRQESDGHALADKLMAIEWKVCFPPAAVPGQDEPRSRFDVVRPS